VNARIDGLSLGFSSSGPQMRGWYLANYDEKELIEMFKHMGLKKDEVKGALALIAIFRRPIR
jgi:hypothetical protein